MPHSASNGHHRRGSDVGAEGDAEESAPLLLTALSTEQSSHSHQLLLPPHKEQQNGKHPLAHEEHDPEFGGGAISATRWRDALKRCAAAGERGQRVDSRGWAA